MYLSEELYEIVKFIISAAAGAGLTIAIVAKFGEKVFFKHLDHKYAEKLSEKNVQLQSELEETKNSLNRSLQQDVASYKSDLEVLSGQRARYLERKIDSILELNKAYVFAINKLLDYIHMNDGYISEAANYFIYQAEDDEFTEYSSYRVYEEIKREYWPKKQEPAEKAVDEYAECLALKMPILPEDFVSSELSLVINLKEIMQQSKRLFYRTMGLTSEIVEPEEDMSPEECLTELKEHMAASSELRSKIESYSDNLIDKAQKSNKLIENLLRS